MKEELDTLHLRKCTAYTRFTALQRKQESSVNKAEHSGLKLEIAGVVLKSSVAQRPRTHLFLTHFQRQEMKTWSFSKPFRYDARCTAKTQEVRYLFPQHLLLLPLFRILILLFFCKIHIYIHIFILLSSFTFCFSQTKQSQKINFRLFFVHFLSCMF